MIEELEKRLTPDGIHLNYLESLGLIEYIRKGMLDEISFNCQQEEGVRLRPGDGVELPLPENKLNNVIRAFNTAGAEHGEGIKLNDQVVCWDFRDNEVYSNDKDCLEEAGALKRILSPDQVINAENA